MRNRNKSRKLLGWAVFLLVAFTVIYIFAVDIEAQPQRESKDITAEIIK